MATCLNCRRKLSCGCQKRTASDGTSACSSCIASYNAKLTSHQPTPKPELKVQPRNPIIRRTR
mgnify:CR=1 FL=1